jgi:hypothetical protein
MNALTAFPPKATPDVSKQPLDASHSMINSNFTDVPAGTSTMSAGPAIRTYNTSAV